MSRRHRDSTPQTARDARRAAQRQYARAIKKLDAIVHETGDYDLDEAWLVIKQSLYPYSVMAELARREERRLIHEARRRATAILQSRVET